MASLVGAGSGALRLGGAGNCTDLTRRYTAVTSPLTGPAELHGGRRTVCRFDGELTGSSG